MVSDGSSDGSLMKCSLQGASSLERDHRYTRTLTISMARLARSRDAVATLKVSEIKEAQRGMSRVGRK